MDLIKVSQAAKLLEVTERFIYKLIDKGDLHKYEDNGAIRVDKIEVLLQKPTILSFFNQKGGVSKTTSCTLLADYLENKKIKTLLVDLDPQASLSQMFFSYEDIVSEKTLTHYFHGKSQSLSGLVRHYSPYVDILPSDIAMASLEFLDTSLLIQKKIQDFYPFFKRYSMVLIDCPPALNAFSRFAIALSHYVFIPLILEKQCYDGLSNALDTIAQISLVNKDFINYYGFASRKTRRRIVLHESYLELYHQNLGEHMLSETLADFIGLAERADQKKNVFQNFDSEQINKIQGIFNEIWREIFIGREL